MQTVIFWLNAFIPREVPGYSQRLAVGRHAGKTAIPLPSLARTWPGNSSKPRDTGYLTDQRTFNSNPASSRRMQSLVEVDLVGLTIIRQAHTSSGTTEVNLATGAQQGFAVANTSRCIFTEIPRSAQDSSLPPYSESGRPVPSIQQFPPTGSPANVFGSLTLSLRASAGDPLVGMAADIDYGGTITFAGGRPGSVVVSFLGFIDDFPAYECYASFNGITKTLFMVPPPPGYTVVNLLGHANRTIGGSAAFP